MGKEDNEHVVSTCHGVPTNAVLLMKGDAWPGIKGSGLTHKSPRGQPPLPKRVLLKCDLTDFRPMLAYEDDPLLDDVASRSRSRSRAQQWHLGRRHAGSLLSRHSSRDQPTQLSERAP